MSSLNSTNWNIFELKCISLSLVLWFGIIEVQSQSLSVKLLAPCKDGKITFGAVTNGSFLGWKKEDGSYAGIVHKDSLVTAAYLGRKTTYVATSKFRNENMVRNGSFEQDTAYLYTDYQYVPQIQQPGDYSIVKNPNNQRFSRVYALIGDHTTGTGKMMIVDGDTNLNSKVVLRAKLAVTKSTSYHFSIWIANIHNKLVLPNSDTSENKMPRLQFSINKETVGIYNFPFDSLWHSFTANWSATKTDTVLLTVVNLQKEQKANDFALDDVDFYSTYNKQELITVEACATSDVFSPDGDGNFDTYYIEDLGTARIFDLDGNLVKEIPTPAYWDGTMRNGLLADAGYYAVVVNEAKSYRVSLMR